MDLFRIRYEIVFGMYAKNEQEKAKKKRIIDGPKHLKIKRHKSVVGGYVQVEKGGRKGSGERKERMRMRCRKSEGGKGVFVCVWEVRTGVFK